MFANLPIHYEEVNTLSEEEKQCPECGAGMIPIGHEEIRTELRYTRAKLERIVYIATTCGCPACKDTEDPRFMKDEGSRHLSQADMLLHPWYHISCMKSMQMRFLCTGRRRDLNFLESVSTERPWRIGSSPAPRTI